MKIRSFQLDFAGRKIPCRAFLPEGEAEQVVMGVHGFAGDKESSVLRKLADALCRHRGALICFDFPAHGESLAPDSQLRVSNCMDDFRTVADYIRQRFPGCRYGVFATSFGGYIALLCADQIPDFRMVLRAPAVTMAESFIRKIIPCSEEDFLASGGAWCGFDRKMFVSADFYRDLKEKPPRIPVRPLLILHGDRDDVIPFGAVEQIAKEYANVVLVPFPGADHRFKGPGEIEKIVNTAMEWMGTDPDFMG